MKFRQDIFIPPTPLLVSSYQFMLSKISHVYSQVVKEMSAYLGYACYLPFKAEYQSHKIMFT